VTSSDGDAALLARSTCEALLITCSDFRFNSVKRRFAHAAGLKDDYDLIARPGGIRSLVAPRDAAAGDSMNDEIRMLRDMHKFTRILAVNHLDCGAYRDIATSVDERDVHLGHLLRAKAMLEAGFPEVRAETYLAEASARGVRVVPVG
jgi:hypothetical protein